MNSMPQQAVTNGNGKNEYFLPQLMTLLSCEVMTPVPNIVSRPIWAPFFGSKCCARVLRTASYPAKLAGPIAVRSTPASLAGHLTGFRRAHECRQHAAG